MSSYVFCTILFEMQEWRSTVLSMVLLCHHDTWPFIQSCLCFLLMTGYLRRTKEARVCKANKGGALPTAAIGFQGCVVTIGVNGRLPRELITEHFQSVLIQLCLGTRLLVNHKPGVRDRVTQRTAIVFVWMKEKIEVNWDQGCQVWRLYYAPLCGISIHLRPLLFSLLGSNVWTPDSHIILKTELGLKHESNNDMQTTLLLLQLETIRSLGFPILTPCTYKHPPNHLFRVITQGYWRVEDLRLCKNN